MLFMAHPSLFRLAALLAFLAMLVPMAALADSCVDCLWGANSTDCCPPACCPCCCQLSPALTAFLATAPGHREADLGEGAQERPVSPDPRDVLHVPKLALA
jgi:hypothetical protein